MNFLILISPALAAGLVPCGGAGELACTPCDFFVLAANAVNLFKNLALAILVVALLFGGIIWTTSGGSEEKIKRGRSIIVGSIIGIFIAYGAWLLVNTIINTLGKGKLEWAWNSIGTCKPPIVTLPTGIVPITQLTGVAIVDNQNATYDLVKSGVIFNSNGDCANAQGTKVSAITNMQELQNGEGLTVCQNGCKAGALTGNLCQKTTGTLNAKLLPELELAKNGTGVNFKIESLTTGDHSPNSDHYKGNAVDIIAANQSDYAALRNQLRVFNAKNAEYDPEKKIFCEDVAGNAVLDCGADTTHLHVGIQ